MNDILRKNCQLILIEKFIYNQPDEFDVTVQKREVHIMKSGGPSTKPYGKP